MNMFEGSLQKQSKSDERGAVWLLVYTLLLIIPALFINLGLMPLILDEGTRADVSMEMVMSGNYIAPTINGEFYYNKPPLFNWLQVLFARITGNFSEFSLRLPVVVSLLLFAFSVYITQKREIGKNAAFLAGLALITCGRILFYDSFKGLIDITFSWVIYLQFWSVFYFFKRKEYYNLFLLSYLFTTLAFMMKGLPALVFQGITLLVWFIWNRRFKRLFSLSHISGFVLFAVVVAAYFFVYNKYNSLHNYFTALVTESTKRTFLENPVGSSIRHLFTFPVEFIFHFLPWTLFALVFLKKGSGRFAWKNEMTRFMILAFLANIIVYWVSPAIYARYFFMFLPLLFGSSFYVLFRYTHQGTGITRYFFKPFILLASAVIAVGLVIFPLFIDTGNYHSFWLKYALTQAMFIPVIVLYFYNRRRWIFVIVPLLLVVRVAFDFFVLPDRIRTGTDLYEANGARVVGELTRGKDLFLLDDTRIQHVSTYYIMRENGRPLTRWNGPPAPGVWYVAEKDKLDGLPPHDLAFTFETRLNGLKLGLVKFNKAE
ncbi:MAG TPA: glycosyltransferase family 39 protein [Bacteroidales bacterium]|nr:glycosyltransferase family 39 protein [Bacteroidales bacterium]